MSLKPPPYRSPQKSVLLPVLALIAATLSMQAPEARAGDEPEKRTISLATTGQVKATPDKVVISTGVTTEGQTARAALDKNNEAMTQVVDGLKAGGIEPKDIQTSNFTISPIYEQRKNGENAFITGYRVTNQVRIIVRDTKKLGDILDKVVEVGANEIGSIQFGMAEPEALKDKARKLAMRNAIADAKLYAETAGVESRPRAHNRRGGRLSAALCRGRRYGCVGEVRPDRRRDDHDRGPP
ncbi:MAG: SIMPL domain-containing protein [Methyloceanibacter sp.]